MKFDYNEKYFKKIYSRPLYGRYLELRNKFIKNEIEKIKTCGNFLEIGFGDGNLIKFLKDKFDVFGIDISEFAVQQIQKSYNPEHFRICDVSAQIPPFPEKFDVICAANLIEHLENPRFALENIFKSLNESGIFVLYLPIQSNIFSKIAYKILQDVPEHVFRPSLYSLSKLLEETGFKKYKEYAASFIPLAISNKFFLSSTNHYLGIWGKIKRIQQG